jgi:hypothetical protein
MSMRLVESAHGANDYEPFLKGLPARRASRSVPIC